ncbi:MFS transporter [Desulfitobacterium chlororespirans]|uniref:Major Facilitator Superfamily protein n=1 Tax=Desulfitobacterium chlororespirans DSM 11544 TaxID=1121395 RepID=A0A1M7SNP0_9FIRM|nr:MFS transporter [Desulfitobacterium chlororespirans]SHN60080.1 Major Facilitator Superfamily protein [Desulfitobacterium chlororespirans DSM 11544]
MNPYQAVNPGKKIMTVIGVYIAMIAAIMMSSGGSTMLPAAAKEIGGESIFSLAQTLLGVCSVALMPLYGYLGARFPAEKRTLIWVSYLITAVIVFSRGLVNSMWAIVIPSFLIGCYSPAIYVLGFSIIRDMYDMKQAGVYLGAVGTMQAIGMLIGPTLTGIIIQTASWRVVNFIIGPLFLLGALLVLAGAKITKEEGKSIARTGTFDLPGAIATVLFLTGLILALSITNYAPFGSPANSLLFAVAAFGLVWLIVIIRKKGTEAFIPAPVLKDQNTLCLTLNNFFCNLSTMALYFFLPAYVINVMKLPPTYAGLVITIYSIPGLFLGPIYGRMIGKAGNARNVSIFAQVIRIGVSLAFIFVLTPSTPIFVVLGLMFLAGFYGASGGVIPAAAPQIQIRPEIRQLGNSMVQLGQNLGGSISIAIYTLVITMAGMVSGIKIACGLAAAFAVIALLVSFPLKKLDLAEEGK